MRASKKRGTPKLALSERVLIERTNAKSVDEAIEIAAAQLRGTESLIPVQLDSIVRSLNVTVTHGAVIDALGETHRLGSGHKVLLRQDASAHRQRFTLAHELAHVYLDRRKRMLPSTVRLEQLCDQLASAVLMPAAEVHARICSRTAAEVLSLSNDFDVSVQAAAIRFAQLTGASVFRINILDAFEQSAPSIHISVLAGALSDRNPDVRRAITESFPDWNPTMAVTVHGLQQRLWKVEFASLHNGNLICTFRLDRTLG